MGRINTVNVRIYSKVNLHVSAVLDTDKLSLKKIAEK